LVAASRQRQPSPIFLIFFTRDRMTVLVVAAFVVIPAMDNDYRGIKFSLFAVVRDAWLRHE